VLNHAANNGILNFAAEQVDADLRDSFRIPSAEGQAPGARLAERRCKARTNFRWVSDVVQLLTTNTRKNNALNAWKETDEWT
jgi:hypothetical protein